MKRLWHGRDGTALLLVGVLFGALLVLGTLPSRAAPGDSLVLGQRNLSGTRQTKLWAAAPNSVLKITNKLAGTPALWLEVRDDSVPPLRVSSPARVPNLNADMVDGRDAAAFLPVAVGVGSDRLPLLGAGCLHEGGFLTALSSSAGDPVCSPPPPTEGFLDSGQSLDANGTTEDVALGDLDGDGDLDAFVAGHHSRVFVNNGAGRFSALESRWSAPDPADFGDAVRVALGDMDGDGDLDVVGVGGVLFNDGSGWFSTEWPAGAGDEDVELGDLDADGDLDVVIAGTPSGILRNDGAGGLTFYRQVFGPSAVDASLGDLNGDGVLDAMVATGGSLEVWLGDLHHTGSFDFLQGPVLGMGVNTDLVTVADADGDGRLDGYAYATGALTVWVNDGPAVPGDPVPAFSASVHTSEIGGEPGALRSGDLDGDRDRDVFVASNTDEASSIWINDGAGIYAAETLGPLNLDGVPTSGAGLGDLDADGDLDLVRANEESCDVWINE